MLRNIFLVIITLSIFSGCVVSKKKYEALLSEKSQLENNLDEKISENKKLNSDLKSAVADYEKVRYSLSKSNAIKSDEVSDLMIQSTAFQKKIEELNEQLKSVQSDFKYNKQSALKTSEQLQTVKKQLTQLQRDTASMHYSIKLAKSRNEMVQKEYSESREKYNTLYTDYSKVKEDAQKKELQLKSLEEQLIGQKETVESISKAFISLRKQLLAAKVSNTPIDPNKNSHIDKIAKLLGHY